MRALIKILGCLFLMSLLALPLTGCESPPWESGMALDVKVDTPRDGTTVNTPAVALSGRVLGSQRAAAKVTVNDADVPVKDGKFSTNATLTEGPNVLNVVARAAGAMPSQKVTVTYVPAK
jgi:hypothetical protein